LKFKLEAEKERLKKTTSLLKILPVENLIKDL